MNSQAAKNLPIVPGNDQNSGPYLDTVSSDGGGAPLTHSITTLEKAEKLLKMEDLWYKSQLCDQVACQFLGATTGRKYFKFIPCLRWFCEECGKKGGRINIKRMSRVLDRLTLDKANTVLRQAVFTVPGNERVHFRTRPALNALIRMAERIINKRFPDLPSIATLHLFGDKGGTRWHPHVHIISIDRRGCRLQLSPEELAGIREEWRFALQAYVLHPVKVANVHLSYVKEYGRILQRIRYLTRPMPGPVQYNALKTDIDLLMFCMVDMQGYIFVRYFNGARRKKIEDPTRDEEVEECKNIAGENLVYMLHGHISRKNFFAEYGPWNADELSPGFYRVRGP